MLKVCRGCHKELDIAANRAFCRKCRKNRPEIYVLWSKKKKRPDSKDRILRHTKEIKKVF